MNHILMGKKKIEITDKGKKSTSGSLEVCSFKPEIFEKLMSSLYKGLEIATLSSRIKGRRLLEVPAWLQMGGTIGEEFLTKNDFELLAVIFRRRVESFLAKLSEVHDFKHNVPQGYKELDDDYTAQASAIDRRKSDSRKDRAGKTLEPDSISMDLQNQRLSRSACKGGTYNTNRHQSTNSHINQNRRLHNLLDDDDISPSDVGEGSEREKDRKRGQGPGYPSDDLGSDSSEDDDSDRRGGNRDRRQEDRRSGGTRSTTADTSSSVTTRFQFDLKLKQEVVPIWDGNTDSIVRWISKVNDLARYGKKVRQQLGSIVPRRLQGSAEIWYFSLSKETRLDLEADWKHLRQRIVDYYMNRKWLNNVRSRA
ncbi:hypothetical protein E1B28_006847 [Marasmius oreades]|uniref:Uncharacterized protein n=1 Tax=Marasmius oreades TaxID=181124 RepID=A0A9P7UX03_9AGAR|nr:uncharacterized protein E1B28_006847 [Marasmius oreades]KAG7096174.1 hypothetical protein E1B28_006847 [Marasmius oreades]